MKYEMDVYFLWPFKKKIVHGMTTFVTQVNFKWKIVPYCKKGSFGYFLTLT